MSRPLRIEYPGAVYHITSRGNEKKPIFQDNQDRENFLNIIQHVNQRFNWICHAYCLMSNHYHLLIETPDGNLSYGMRQLNGVFTQLVNKRHDRTGHLFQGRYKAILIQKDSHLLEVCRYVVLNPVKAKMVERLEEHPWSSYMATAGKTQPHPCLTTSWILSQFSGKPGDPEQKYQQFVSSGIGQKAIWEQVRGQTLLGEDDFVDKLTHYLRKHETISEIPRNQRYLHRPALESIFRDDVRVNIQKRRMAICEAVEKYGYRQREIANYLGLHYSSVSKIMKGER